MPKNDSITFDFGETVDYDTADKILTGAGLRLEKDGYNYSRNPYKQGNSEGVVHSTQDIISHGKNHQEHFYMSVDLEKGYNDSEIDIKAASRVTSGGSQISLLSELKEFEGSLEEECKRVLGN